MMAAMTTKTTTTMTAAAKHWRQWQQQKQQRRQRRRRQPRRQQQQQRQQQQHEINMITATTTTTTAATAKQQKRPTTTTDNDGSNTLKAALTTTTTTMAATATATTMTAQNKHDYLILLYYCNKKATINNCGSSDIHIQPKENTILRWHPFGRSKSNKKIALTNLPHKWIIFNYVKYSLKWLWCENTFGDSSIPTHQNPWMNAKKWPLQLTKKSSWNRFKEISHQNCAKKGKKQVVNHVQRKKILNMDF